MKPLRFLILGLGMAATICRAQINEPGFFQSSGTPLIPLFAGPGANTSPALTSGINGINPMDLQGGSVIAETITPEIQALADGLQDDPVKIFNYVHDHIRFVLYFGAKKGATLTLLEKSGNDFDQSALLVALLRAAGYSPGYGFGVLKMPYDSSDHNDLHHWLQLNEVNTNWTSTLDYVAGLLGKRGYLSNVLYYYDLTNTLGFSRVWVTLAIGSTNYALDPAFKVSEPVTGINLASAIGFSSNAVMTAAGGTSTTSYVTNLNEASLGNTLTGYTTNFLNYLKNNNPNASVEEILGGWRIVSSTNTALSQTLLFPQDTDNFTEQDWDNEPTNFMSSLTIAFANTNHQWWMPELQGQRLTLTYATNGLAQLWQDDTLLADNSTTAANTNVVISVNHPYGSWDFTHNTFVDGTIGDQITTNTYQRTNATYGIMYAFEPDWGWLKQRQNKLDAYRQAGLADNTRQVVSETLNIMGLGWMLQTAYVDRILAQQMGVLPQYHHRLGRMAQESGKGYYVDVYMQVTGAYADSDNQDSEKKDFAVTSYFWSSMEHGIIEQLQSSNIVAASTVKMLQVANANHQAVYLTDVNNWSTVKNSLTNYNLASLGNFITQGYTLLLPQNGANRVAGNGTWRGYGVMALRQSGGTESVAMLIGGGYFGGYSSLPGVTADPSYVGVSGDVQPFQFNNSSAFTFNLTAGDPVDMANGTFQVEHADLSLGQAEPRGITLSRYYNGTRRYSNPSDMADGWVNNYSVKASAVAAPQAGLGGTTPAQMASMLAATATAINVYDLTPNPKNWMVTALVAKWGVDQLARNGVSISLGKDAVQFVRQPNGTYTPPGNCTMTLAQSGSDYTLQMRHGNTFKFDSMGRLTNIVDRYSQPLKLTYNASNWVSTVKDWKNRQLTFNYTGTPQRLTSVSDGTRTVSYGYSTNYNPQGDLTSFTDAESKTSTYIYDTNHQITATLDAQNRLVVSNIYDLSGHVATQYTEGKTNEMWQIFWSDWQSGTLDPAGGLETYFYDDKSRIIGSQDALGNLTQTFYDGQDHVVENVSPLNETNQFIYDGDNNLIVTIDPLGFTNQFIYDNQDNLIRTIDPRDNPSTFGYNAQFSLTGQTNGAGDWMTFLYNSDGTLHTQSDPGGTTTYGYDSLGQLHTITYPNGLGEETFNNSWFGDVTNHVNGRGFATAFQYNSRRELTNTVAPTNLVTSFVYDSVGNVASTKDARGYVTTNIWSATRHLLSTILPAMPQGAPVITNVYDSRDWLSRTINPLQHATIYTNDAAHRLASATDPVLRTTRFGYDADGRKLSTTNAAEEVVRQTWNGRGQLVLLTDGANHNSSHAYDAAGNQIILTNRNGKKWQFQFDAANRLTNTITPLNRQTWRVFNNRGLLDKVREPSEQWTTNFYDAKGRLTNRLDTVASTAFRYDANDNMTNITEGANSLTRTFDAYDRMSSFKDIYGNLIQYRYDGSGNLTNLVYPGNRNVYYAYDSNNHLTNVTDWATRKTSFTYDLAGRLKTITRPNGTERIISYDDAGQTTNIVEQTALGFPIALFRYNWNSNATVQWEFAAPLPHTNAPPARTMTYDDDNRLASVNSHSVTMDSDGNLTYGPLTNDTFATYAFDARNRLQDVGGVTNIYNVMNNRVGQIYGTNTTVFVMNPNAKLPQVLERIKNGVTNYYIYGAGLLYQITETATTTNTLTYHYDYRGSTIALTDDSGLVKDRFEYSLYATLTYRIGNSDTPFLFNGRYGVESDPNGLLYMRARYYNPYLCRFINADPSGFNGGLNFYAYANGNPVSYLDPFGLSVFNPGLVFYLQGPGSQQRLENINQNLQTINYGLAGAAVGVGTAGIVTLAAPAAVSGLVASGMSETVASAIVTVGLGSTAVFGGVTTGVNTYNNAVAGNWNAVAFNAGTLVGGGIVGVIGGGGLLAEGVSGQPTSASPGLFGDSGLGYNPNYPNGSILSWFGSGPTPQSGGGAAALTAAGAGVFLQPSQQSPSQWSWFTPSINSGSSGQSSSTGK